MLKHRADLRQIGTVALYQTLLGLMFFVPECRNVFFLAAACALSFLNAVVIHNVMHDPPFESGALNTLFRWIISFGNLYPASSNIPAHNLVHHRFDDDGLPDWASPDHVELPHPLLTLIHFPNVVGPNTFAGVTRFARRKGKAQFKSRYTAELIFAFGLTILLLVLDFWTALLFIVVPQLFGARWILRINLIQHLGTRPESEHDHSRNFVGRAFNWIMMNNGYHTIHHDNPSRHWSELAEAHEKEVKPFIDPRLDQPSMFGWLARTFLLGRPS